MSTRHLAKAAEERANHLSCQKASVRHLLVEMNMGISSAFSNTSPLEELKMLFATEHIHDRIQFTKIAPRLYCTTGIEP